MIHATLIVLYQAGELRKGSEAAEQTFQQLLKALEPNVVTALADSVKDSGIKDTLAQPIIDNLVKLGTQLRKTASGRDSLTPDIIQDILTNELKKANGSKPGPNIINPLVMMDGK